MNLLISNFCFNSNTGKYLLIDNKIGGLLSQGLWLGNKTFDFLYWKKIYFNYIFTFFNIIMDASTNHGAVKMSWTDGLRIVDMCELARQMYCKKCLSLLDLNSTKKETRIGLASVLFITCGCGVVNEVHSSKKLLWEGKQGHIEAYQINVSLLKSDSVTVRNFLAVLHIPWEPLPVSADSIEGVLHQSDQAIKSQQGQADLPPNKNMCFQEACSQESLGLQYHLHCSAISELHKSSHLNHPASVSHERAELVHLNEDDIEESLHDGEIITDNNDNDSSKPNCSSNLSVSGIDIDIVDNSSWESENSECNQHCLPLACSLSNDKKSTVIVSNKHQTTKVKQSICPSARHGKRKLQNAVKTNNELGLHKDDKVTSPAFADNLSTSLVGLAKSCNHKRSMRRAGQLDKMLTLSEKRKGGQARHKHGPPSAEFKCLECSKIMCSSRSLRTHLKKAHIKLPTNTLNASTKNANEIQLPDQTRIGIAEPLQEGWALQKDQTVTSTAEQGVNGKCQENILDSPDKKNICLHNAQLKHISRKSIVHKSENPKTVHDRLKLCGGRDLHRGRQQEQPVRKQHVCKKCPAEFLTASQLKIHSKSHATSEPAEVHECTICLKTFPNGRRLRAHRTTHTREERLCPLKRYKCELCGEEFKKNYFLQIHLRYHKGERPYKCPICELTFVTKPERRAHFKKCVVKKKTYLCEQCGSRFGSACTLRKHERVHTGEKPHRCRYCEKAFSRTNTLKIHERQHTGERPYVCDQCTAAFKQRVSLVTHMRSKHNINVTLYSQPRDGPRYTHSVLAWKHHSSDGKPAATDPELCKPSSFAEHASPQCVSTEHVNTVHQHVSVSLAPDFKNESSDMYTLSHVAADIDQTPIPDAPLPQAILMPPSGMIHFSSSSSENIVELGPAARIVSLSQDVPQMRASVDQQTAVLQESHIVSTIQAPEAQILAIPSQETGIFTLCHPSLSAALESVYYN